MRSLVWLAVLSLTAYSFTGCKLVRKIMGCPENPPSSRPQGNAQIPPPNSINLSLSRTVSDGEIKNRLVASFTPAKFTPADIVVRHCKCDSDLINLALPNSFTIVIEGSQGPLVVKSGDGATGGDVDLPLAGKGSNFRLSPLVTEKESQYRRADQQIDTSMYNPAKTVSIAVFDTGLTGGFLRGGSWQQATTQCAAPATTSLVGWNFTTEGAENDAKDNSPIQHGSRVANLVARQFNGGTITPKIIPMKVLSGTSNQGDLFELICAMETARKNNVQVFNMSLGYYGDEDPLLREYIKRAVDDRILIVTAAGNQADSTVERDLQTMTSKFYPAAFSLNFDRVIAVTTVHLQGTPGNETLIGCPLQNYGAMNVLGVLQQEECRFELVPTGSGFQKALIEGSSYATPIMTGWLAHKLGENPASVIRWPTLPPLLKQAKHGQQLYRNAYLIPMITPL